MNALIEYLIPIRGLKIGLHHYNFQINQEFFSNFPDSLIDNGEFEVQLDFEKRIDLFELVFSYNGFFNTACDRCLVNIDFPIKGKNQMIIKFAEEFLEEAEVEYIPLKTEKLNVAKYIYEFICLAVPFVKVYDCQAEREKPCDEKMLAFLEKEKAEKPVNNPLWDNLKNIKFN